MIERRLQFLYMIADACTYVVACQNFSLLYSTCDRTTSAISKSLVIIFFPILYVIGRHRHFLQLRIKISLSVRDSTMPAISIVAYRNFFLFYIRQVDVCLQSRINISSLSIRDSTTPAISMSRVKISMPRMHLIHK